MAITIGGISCDYLYGEIPSLKMLTEEYHRPGMNGIGVRQMGTGDGAFQLRAVLFAGSTGDVTTWIGQIEALAGTIVSVVDVWGNTKTNCLIKSVAPAQKQAIISTSDVCYGDLNIQGEVVS